MVLEKPRASLAAPLTGYSDFHHSRSDFSARFAGNERALYPAGRGSDMRALIVAAFILAICSNAFSQRTVKKPAPHPKPNATTLQRQATEAEDKEAIEQLHHDDIAASLAFDVDKLTATWDDEIVSMPPNSKPLVGKAANHEYLLSQQKALANVEILGYEETWDEVRIIGDYAY